MTTLLAVYNSSGCVGRCDANCYLARRQKCTCICGGKNHGAGLQAASENVAAMVGLGKEDLETFAQATKRDAKELTVINRLRVPSAYRARRQARDKLAQPDMFEQ